MNIELANKCAERAMQGDLMIPGMILAGIRLYLAEAGDPDTLKAERDAAIAEVGRISRELGTVEAERDQLRADLARTESDRDEWKNSWFEDTGRLRQELAALEASQPNPSPEAATEPPLTRSEVVEVLMHEANECSKSAADNNCEIFYRIGIVLKNIAANLATKL